MKLLNFTEKYEANAREVTDMLDLLRSPDRYSLSNLDVSFRAQDEYTRRDRVFFEVRKITYEKEAPWKEALEIVLSEVRHADVNFLYLLLGDRAGVHFYYGLSRRDRKTPELGIPELGRGLLQAGLQGNYRGSDIRKLEPGENQKIVDAVKSFRFLARIEGVPGSVKDDERFQSVDRLTDVMQGSAFAVLVIADAMDAGELSEVESRLYGGYEVLSPAARSNKQIGRASGTGGNQTSSENESLSWEAPNKRAQQWVQYIDEVIAKRLDYGRGKGAFHTAFYVMSDSLTVQRRLENTVLALYSGREENRVPLRAVRLSDAARRQVAVEALRIPEVRLCPGRTMPDSEILSRALLSQQVRNDGYFPLGNWMTTKELSMIAGLPRKEVQGLTVREEIAFGLTVPERGIERKRSAEERQREEAYLLSLTADGDSIPLGYLVKDGLPTSAPVCLSRRTLDRHIFVSGVTGSGKTTTCQALIKRSGLPFWVIEPAKTEYRTMEDTLVFTLGDEGGAPFRFNPFELLPGESISAHVDAFRASLEAAFDMEAAIPQILESALYNCYEAKGWDMDRNTHPRGTSPGVFPTLDDLLEQVDRNVKEQGFAERLQSDYIGSIRARLQSLLLGAKGKMLNCQKSVDFTELLDRNVVLELENIRNGAQKSFLMGLILSRYQEAVRLRYQRSGERRPGILLIEEAHRLLGKYQPGDAPTKKQGVEIFTDMLAEIRKYGVCLMIADQIPNKLADDVLKNTNTKIVHRIFAQDDKDAIGNSIALSDDQKRFLSSLRTGRVILYAEDYERPVQVQVQESGDTSSNHVEESELRRKSIGYYYGGGADGRGILLPMSFRGLTPEKREELFLFACRNVPVTLYRGYRDSRIDTRTASDWARRTQDDRGMLCGLVRGGTLDKARLTDWICRHAGESEIKVDNPRKSTEAKVQKFLLEAVFSE